jgi:hypothetical protein
MAGAFRVQEFCTALVVNPGYSLFPVHGKIKDA